MKPARYIFLNQGLQMSTGKASAQAAHAEMLAMSAYLGTPNDHDIAWMNKQQDLYAIWMGYGHYAKYVCAAEDSLQIHTIKYYLDNRGFETYLVIDEGHTEGTYFVPTAMAVELIDKDDERDASIFGEFKLYKDKKPKPEPKKRFWRR